MLKLNGITKIYEKGTVNELTVFDNFNFEVRDGEFVSVIGSNGSGKTTLLNVISGNVPVDSGSIILNDKDITRAKEHKRARYIGRVFQNPSVGTAPNMTIAENMSMADDKGKLATLAFGLNKSRLGYYKDELSRLNLGLEDKLTVKAGALSGGQRQALALIMSTLSPLKLLLLDEHTAALDPKTSETIMRLTDEIVREKKLTTIMVTHNLLYAVKYGTRLIMMDKGKVITDKSGDEKSNTDIKSILDTFNTISLEKGN